MNLFRLLLISLVFALVANGFSIYLAICSPVADVGPLDIDEYLYLSKSKAVASGLPADTFFYLEHKNSSSVLLEIFRRPSAITDLAVGVFANLLSLKNFYFGLALDLICSFFCFAFLSQCFYLCLGKVVESYIGAAISIFFPFLLVPTSSSSMFFPLFSALFGEWYQPTYRDFSLPVFRGVYTQVSEVVYAAGLYLLAKSWRATDPRFKVLPQWILAGLSFYVYFFCWVTLVELIGSFFLLRAVLNGKNDWRQSLRTHALGFFLHLIIILPGLFILHAGRIGGIVATDSIRKYYFFSWFPLLSAIPLLILGFRMKDRQLALPLLLLGTMAALELLLMNIQTILSQVIAPYHFTRYYLHPILSGLGSALIVLTLRQTKYWRPVFYGMLVPYFVCWIGFQESSALTVFKSQFGSFQHELLDLVLYLQRSTPKDSVINVMQDWAPFRAEAGEEFSSREFPVAIASLAERPILSQDWQYQPPELTDVVFREFASSWYYSGSLNFLWPCPTEIKLPGDIFVLTWTALLIHRQQQCALTKEIVSTLNPCKVLHMFKTDYVLWESWMNNYSDTHLTSIADLVWSSNTGIYRLYKIDHQKVENLACNAKIL